MSIKTCEDIKMIVFYFVIKVKSRNKLPERTWTRDYILKELTKWKMALVEDFLKREWKVLKKELGATHFTKYTIDCGEDPPIEQNYHARRKMVQQAQQFSCC